MRYAPEEGGRLSYAQTRRGRFNNQGEAGQDLRFLQGSDLMCFLGLHGAPALFTVHPLDLSKCCGLSIEVLRAMRVSIVQILIVACFVAATPDTHMLVPGG